MTGVLVAYASENGSTEEVAQKVAEVLKQGDLQVKLQAISGVDSLADYDAFVIGSAVYNSNWLPEAKDFVARHANRLKQGPTAMFSLGIMLANDTENTRESLESATSPERTLMQPRIEGIFAGRLDYSMLSPIVRLKAKTRNLPEGDFRDWDTITEWAESVRAAFEG